jgi:hypothetical protein
MFSTVIGSMQRCLIVPRYARRWGQRRLAKGPLRPGKGARIGIVADEPVSMQMTEAIRQRAGYGPPPEQPQDTTAEPEPAPRDVDFGAGAVLLRCRSRSR